MAALGLIAGGCRGANITQAAPVVPITTAVAQPTATPTPTPEPTPVVPTTGGTYELVANFVRVEGSCGGPTTFQAGLVIVIDPGPPSGPSPDSLGITFSQPLTGDVNTGFITPGGEYEVSSENEEYSGLLVFERDEAGNPVLIQLTGPYIWRGPQNCEDHYDATGEGAVEGQ